MKQSEVVRIWGLCVLVLLWAGAAQAASLTLAWNPSSGATGYRLYWGTQSGVHSSSVDVGNQTSRPVTGLVNGTRYYFVVRAYNASGSLSNPSNEISGMSSSLPSDPQMVLDGPANGSTVGSSFNVSGWTIDRGAQTGTGIDAVHVYVFPSGSGTPVFVRAVTYGTARGDIGSLFGSQFTNSGFSLTVPGIASGSYQVIAYGHSTVSNSFAVTQVANITVSGLQSQPQMSLDGPQNNTTVGKTVTVGGWAIDLGASNGTGVDAVHVWAFPNSGGAGQFLGVAQYGLARPDIGAAFGSRFTNSGYQLNAVVAPAGLYRIVAYASSTVAGTFNAAAGADNVNVQDTNSNAVLFVDTPEQNATATRPFTVSGWAVDQGASGTGITDVHIWAFPTTGASATLVGVATYGTPRPDIGLRFGDTRFNDSGYTFTATSANLAAGTYDLIVFGKSMVTNNFIVARVVRVTVQ